MVSGVAIYQSVMLLKLTWFCYNNEQLEFLSTSEEISAIMKTNLRTQWYAIIVTIRGVYPCTLVALLRHLQNWREGNFRPFWEVWGGEEQK